jgi:dTDP-glucose 4,6-dehydratase
VLRIAQDVLSVTGSASPITFVDRPVDDPAVRRPDTSLAQQRLGWSPRVDWIDGLTGTVAWFRSVAALSA